MREFTHLIGENEAGRTVKSIALKTMRLSRGQFSSLKFQHGLLVDGVPAHADMRLLPGQRLTALFRDEAPPILPYDVPLSIPFADADYWVIDKPAPLPTLSSARQAGGTLENALYAHLGCPENFVFRPVNRLDKGTSGLLVAARNAHAQQLLQAMLHTDRFTREYLAICRGAPREDAGTIDLPIGKAGEGARREIAADGRPAVTHYRVELRGKQLSLVRLRLETGRTHQIRVHMMALGCPILGDYLYGEPSADLAGRFALHSCALRFTHPLTGAVVAVESPLPACLTRFLKE